MAETAGDSPRLRTRIDRKSPLPYYVQLKDALEEMIGSGEWKAGARIPSEAELCNLFDVSRTVVRQALKEMAYEGLILREKGRGTFVAEPKIRSRSLVHSLVGFYEDMADRGHPPVTKVLEQGIEPASPKLADTLELEPNAPVIKLVRLRFVQEEPIVLVSSYLPYDLCPKLINADLTDQSLYAFLKQEYGLSVGSGRRRIDAVLADDHEANLLQIEKGAPLLRLDSVSYLADGTPLEYFQGVFRSDRSQFEVEIDRTRGGGISVGSTEMDRENDWLG